MTATELVVEVFGSGWQRTLTSTESPGASEAVHCVCCAIHRICQVGREKAREKTNKQCVGSHERTYMRNVRVPRCQVGRQILFEMRAAVQPPTPLFLPDNRRRRGIQEHTPLLFGRSRAAASRSGVRILDGAKVTRLSRLHRRGRRGGHNVGSRGPDALARPGPSGELEAVQATCRLLPAFDHRTRSAGTTPKS